MFFKDKFSLFAYLGDLSQYSFQELKEKLFDDYHLSISEDIDKFTAKWWDKATEIEIYFTLDGHFIKIKSEKWQDLGLHFIRN
jgi:hypothetical protein